ncbi:hypothetical protein MKW94_002622 [Papaver nudicaule]|uniref:Uncharacterized protein n=1 Tax=Papaver nudicaule TaxID=74823 RepID=A0AA41S2S9_PAPNU|nr:hypothetical protein [Papaver nudicaule]
MCVNAAARAPPPAPAQSGGGGMLGGLGATIAQGMAFGGGSVMAHRAVDSIMGPRTIQHEAVGSDGVGPAAASVGGSDACGNQNKAFQDMKSRFYLNTLTQTHSFSLSREISEYIFSLCLFVRFSRLLVCFFSPLISLQDYVAQFFSLVLLFF